MKRLLTRFAPLAAAALLGVTASLVVASPASAKRIDTTLDATSMVRICPSSNCRSVGNAVSGTAARSYCFIGDFDMVFSVGAPLRLGFIPFRSLVDETQDTGCPDGGFPTSVDHDVNLRDCAISSCIVIGRLSSGDTLRQYCLRSDAFGNIWIGVFKQSGQRVGFALSTDLIGAPNVNLRSC